MLETPEEIDRLQQLLDRSAAAAGARIIADKIFTFSSGKP
jgi:hypothetical protein